MYLLMITNPHIVKRLIIVNEITLKYSKKYLPLLVSMNIPTLLKTPSLSKFILATCALLTI